MDRNFPSAVSTQSFGEVVVHFSGARRHMFCRSAVGYPELVVLILPGDESASGGSLVQHSVAESSCRVRSRHHTLLAAFGASILGAIRTLGSLVWPSAMKNTPSFVSRDLRLVTPFSIALPAVGASSSASVAGGHLKFAAR